MFHVSDEEFERLVADALDEVPDRMAAWLENVVVTVVDEPADWQLEDLGERGDDNFEVVDDELLGLYDGLPITERGQDYGMADLPDEITIFKGPHERVCGSAEELAREVRLTVLHEVGHAFGNDERALEALGLG